MQAARVVAALITALTLAAAAVGCGDERSAAPAAPRVATIVQDDVAIDVAFWAPRWAVQHPGRRSDRERDSIVVGAFADFAEAVARRYTQAVAFTVWNEPNHNTFLLPQWERSGGEWRPASPHRYRAMVRADVPRIQAAAPGALVLIGATSSVGLQHADEAADRMAPLTFLREMACVDERLEPLRRPECRSFQPLPGDGWSHHPYSLDLPPWSADPQATNVRMGDLSRLTALLRRLHDAGRTRKSLEFYLTESGYQTNPPGPTWRVSLTDQARWLPEGERIARAQPSVRGVAQFLVRDLPQRPGAGARLRWSYGSLRFSGPQASKGATCWAAREFLSRPLWILGASCETVPRPRHPRTRRASPGSCRPRSAAR